MLRLYIKAPICEKFQSTDPLTLSSELYICQTDFTININDNVACQQLGIYSKPCGDFRAYRWSYRFGTIAYPTFTIAYHSSRRPVGLSPNTNVVGLYCSYCLVVVQRVLPPTVELSWTSARRSY